VADEAREVEEQEVGEATQGHYSEPNGADHPSLSQILQRSEWLHVLALETEGIGLRLLEEGEDRV